MKKILRCLVCLVCLLCLFGCSSKEKELKDVVEGKWYYLDTVYLELGENNSASYYKAYVSQVGNTFTDHLTQYTGFYTIEDDGITLTINYNEEGDVGSSKRISCNYVDIFEFSYNEEGTPVLTMINSRGGLDDLYVKYSATFKKS